MKLLLSLSILSMLAFAGCESTNARGPGGKELTITTPPSLLVNRGGSHVAQFAVNRIGFSNPVTLTISDLPSGVTVTPVKETVEAGTTTFTFMAAPNAPLVANHNAKVTGTSGPDGVDVIHRFNISVNE